MKKLILFWLFALSLLQAGAQITFTAPVAYTTGVPTGAPSGQGSRLRIDLLTGWLYEWSPVASGWLKMGQGIDQTSGSVAPAYTPGIGQSWYAVNGANQLYRYTGTGTAWDCLNCTAGAVASVNGLSGTVLLDLSLSGTTLSLTGDASPVSFANWDTNASDDFSGSWNDLTSVPAGFADGTDDGTTYTAGAGISINGSNVITNTGDTDGTDDITTATTLNGDLAGSLPNPTVDGLRGVSVSATTPTNGQVLKFNGTAWAPGADAGGDNLGNHTATQDLNVAGHEIDNFYKINYVGSGGISEPSSGYISYNGQGVENKSWLISNPSDFSSLSNTPQNGLKYTQQNAAGENMLFYAVPSAFFIQGLNPGLGKTFYLDGSYSSISQSIVSPSFSGKMAIDDVIGINIYTQDYTKALFGKISSINPNSAGIGVYDGVFFSHQSLSGIQRSDVALTTDTIRLFVTGDVTWNGLRGITINADSVVIGSIPNDPTKPFTINTVVVNAGDSTNYAYYTQNRVGNIVQNPRAIADVESVMRISGQASSITVSTDGSGYATISHPLGYTPSAIVASYQGDNPFFITVTSKTTTDFTVRVWDNAGSSVNSSNIDFSYWIR